MCEASPACGCSALAGINPQALALGASAVLVGRPVLYGLALGGQAGVERVLSLLKRELELAMALAGFPNLAAVGPHLLHPVGLQALLSAGCAGRGRGCCGALQGRGGNTSCCCAAQAAVREQQVQQGSGGGCPVLLAKL
jgi:hypothetical protein